MASMSIAKRLGAAVVALLIWEVVNLTFAHWWAIATASEDIMGTAHFLAREVLRNAPALAYFFSVGLVFSLMMGAREGGMWAIFTAATATCINALLAKFRFYEGVSSIEIAVLMINYGLPIVFAAGGALFVYKWRHVNRGTVTGRGDR